MLIRTIASGVIVVALLSLLASGCGAGVAERAPTTQSSNKGAIKTMKLTSSGFAHGAKIPATYTAEGEDLSPPLAWSGAPEGTQSFVLICDDPDAPSPRQPAAEPWVHWVLFNIPAAVTELPRGIRREKEPAQVPGARQGVNSWPRDNLGYRGPAPPPGSGRHRYFFRLHALDTQLDLAAGATVKQLRSAMSGHVLAEGQLMGTCER